MSSPRFPGNKNKKMKLFNIIRKNIKLLLRSRVASLILIFGPLVIIMLVGISFSTNTFNLNIGTYSDRYSDMSTSLIANLKSERYATVNFESEDACIESIKTGETHACVVFPPDMTVENDNTNEIKIYVDQSKINLAYLVMSTLTSSFGEESTQISKELTDKIVASLFSAKATLQDAQSFITEIKNKNIENTEQAKVSSEKLGNLDLEADSNIVVDARTSRIKYDLDKLLEDTGSIVKSSLTLVDNLDEWTYANGTAYLNSLESKLLTINTTLITQHNATVEELDLLVQDINNSLADLSSKLDKAKTANSEVISKLNAIKGNADIIHERITNIEENTNGIISDINSIKVTNSENIASPITTQILPIVKSQTNLGFLFPSLIVMLIMFIGLILPSTLIIMEKNSKAYFRVFTTPTRNWLFLVSTYLTSMILIFFQVIIILLVSHFYFKLNVISAFFVLILSLILIMSLFIFIGMLIGNLFNSEEMAMLAAVSLGSLFLLTSGIIFPLESMPSYIVEKAKFNPMVLSSELFKRSLLFNAGFESVKSSLFYLFIFSLIAVLLLFAIKKSEKIISLIKRPNKSKVKKEFLISQFDFGERKAKTLPEFIVSIQNLSRDKFDSLLGQSVYHDWLMMVYKNKEMALKIKNIKTKEELTTLLVDELKKMSEKSR
jgi:ABC-2 type transport system permease protein